MVIAFNSNIKLLFLHFGTEGVGLCSFCMLYGPSQISDIIIFTISRRVARSATSCPPCKGGDQIRHRAPLLPALGFEPPTHAIALVEGRKGHASPAPEGEGSREATQRHPAEERKEGGEKRAAAVER